MIYRTCCRLSSKKSSSEYHDDHYVWLPDNDGHMKSYYAVRSTMLPALLIVAAAILCIPVLWLFAEYQLLRWQ